MKSSLITISVDLNHEASRRKWLLRSASRTRTAAISRGIGFDFELEYAEVLFLRQYGRCAVTRIPFHMQRFSDAFVKYPFAPSIDRILSSGSYTQDNARLVCAAVNFGMGQWGEELFLTLARYAVAYDRAKSANDETYWRPARMTELPRRKQFLRYFQPRNAQRRLIILLGLEPRVLRDRAVFERARSKRGINLDPVRRLPMTGPNRGVMAGLVPAIHAPPAPTLAVSVDARHKAGHDDVRWRCESLAPFKSAKSVIEVVPIWVRGENEPHLPGPRPMLHVLFALNGGSDVGVLFEEDQPLQPVPLSEAGHNAFAMLPNAARKVAGHAGVQNAVRPVSHDVNPGSSHRRKMPAQRTGSNASVDGRDKPGHDDEVVWASACAVGRDSWHR